MSTVDVTNQFNMSKANKSPSPDCIPGRLVELCPAFQSLFQQYVDTGVIPTI